jgi:hypothetical protein
VRIRPLILAWATTAALAIAATGCAHDAAPVSQGQTPTTVSPSPSVVALRPNDRGYVRVEVPSASVGCSITVELVACQRFSGVWHDADGQIQHTASIDGGGEFHWVNADLGELQGRVSLGSHTYSAQGWTIAVQPGTTRFVNDHSGHGMTVDAERVTPF